MELFLLALLAAVLGYFLARSKYRKNVDQAAQAVSTTTKDLTGRSSGWLRSRFGRRTAGEAFRAWASGTGASSLPEEFKEWLTSLSKDETEEFTRALSGYTKGLGFEVDRLVKGEYSGKPALMQVYVEALVIYSQAYRKAKQAKQVDVQASPANPEETSQQTDNKQPAEKSVSRRKSGEGEASEPIPVV